MWSTINQPCLHTETSVKALDTEAQGLLAEHTDELGG